ncbi:hypothetical protein BOM_1284 (plasmid) [Borrelia miyamotoi FR64b]|uniref:Uncharacterized protein n=1 Tax=Borrelia miyamotoi FR64b TaxID=1292392 RepID=W5SFY2_9SPIR|nr:hypothetical protein BOM_1284 [Borrelia miyamotoi FR64b]
MLFVAGAYDGFGLWLIIELATFFIASIFGIFYVLNSQLKKNNINKNFKLKAL